MNYPTPVEADIVEDLISANGETLPQVRMHMRTIGQPQSDAD